jgi:regulator of sigma E protease
MHPTVTLASLFGFLNGLGSMPVGIVVMILSLCFLITIHEAGHWLVARLLGFQTPVFSIGFGPRKWSIVLGRFWDTEFRLSPILAGGYVSLPEMQDETTALEAAKEQGLDLKGLRFFPVWKRTAVALAGVFFNFLGAIAMLFLLFAFLGEPSMKVDNTFVKGVSQTVTVARDAGIQPGDVFVSVAGKTVVKPEDLSQALAATHGQPVSVVVKRQGKDVSVNLTPDKDNHIGVVLDVNGTEVFQAVPVGKAAYDAGRVTTSVLGQTVRGVGMMLHIVPRPPEVPASAMEVRGIVGIVTMGATAYGTGLFNFVWFLVVISVNLIVMNMLPFPALDGGHVLFFLIEKVRGKPVDAALKGRLTMVFIFLLLSLFMLGLVNDIGHIAAGK